MQEMLTGFFYNIISKVSIINTKSDIDFCMYVILIVGLIYIIVQSIYGVFKTEFVIKVKTHKEHRIVIKIGNYEENMAGVLDDSNDMNERAIFVIGINNEMNMMKAEESGVHRAVINKFYYLSN